MKVYSFFEKYVLVNSSLIIQPVGGINLAHT